MNESSRVDIEKTKRLVKDSQSNNKSAFDELVRLHQQQMMKLAIRMLGDAQMAAEAVQQGFVKAYQNINKLRDQRRFEAWLLRIVANEAINQRRDAKRRLEKTNIVDDYIDAKAANPADRKASQELKEAIVRAMSKLAKKEAKAIALFGLEDLSYKQAAEIMGCSTGAVRWHVFRARQKLRILLKEHIE